MSDTKNKLVFEKVNYIIMVVGVLFLALGFYVMTMDVGANEDWTDGITVGPIIIFIGFLVEFGAILYKPKKQ